MKHPDEDVSFWDQRDQSDVFAFSHRFSFTSALFLWQFELTIYLGL
jgi:hypothetical protein